MQQRVVVGAFIYNNGKFLIAKRADDDTFLPGIWEIPGGKLEIGEKPIEGVIREIQEEMGIKIKPLMPFSAFNYENGNGEIHYVQIDYICTPVETEIKLSNEHSDFAWITFEEIDNYNITPEMKAEILKLKNNHILSLPTKPLE